MRGKWFQVSFFLFESFDFNCCSSSIKLVGPGVFVEEHEDFEEHEDVEDCCSRSVKLKTDEFVAKFEIKF